MPTFSNYSASQIRMFLLFALGLFVWSYLCSDFLVINKEKERKGVWRWIVPFCIVCCCVHSIYLLCYLCYVVFGCSLFPLSLFAFMFPVTGEGIKNITPSANILGSPCFNSCWLFCVHSILLYVFVVFAVFCFSVYLHSFSYMGC